MPYGGLCGAGRLWMRSSGTANGSGVRSASIRATAIRCSRESASSRPRAGRALVPPLVRQDTRYPLAARRRFPGRRCRTQSTRRRTTVRRTRHRAARFDGWRAATTRSRWSTIFAGDIFALDRDALGRVDAIYDRAALVALPAATRTLYAAHLLAITDRAPQFVITFDYDQSRMDGPPFSVNEAEMRAHYGDAYRLSSVESSDIPGGLKGFCPARELSGFLSRARRAAYGRRAGAVISLPRPTQQKLSLD